MDGIAELTDPVSLEARAIHRDGSRFLHVPAILVSMYDTQDVAKMRDDLSCCALLLDSYGDELEDWRRRTLWSILMQCRNNLYPGSSADNPIVHSFFRQGIGKRAFLDNIDPSGWLHIGEGFGKMRLKRDGSVSVSKITISLPEYDVIYFSPQITVMVRPDNGVFTVAALLSKD